MTEIFTVTVEPEWIYSVWGKRPRTPVQNHYKATQWRALILDFLSFPPSPVYFNHCIYQHLSRSFYLGKSRKVIMMWCLKIEDYVIAGHLISTRYRKSVSCLQYLFESHILTTKIKSNLISSLTLTVNVQYTLFWP